MEVIRHDVVLVGGGGAGLRAAIAVAEADVVKVGDLLAVMEVAD